MTCSPCKLQWLINIVPGTCFIVERFYVTIGVRDWYQSADGESKEIREVRRELPELPEVETIKNELLPHVTGRQFSEITIYDVRAVLQPPVEEFCLKLMGQRVDNLERRGKYLIFHISGGGVLIIHLRMTGALLLNPAQVDRYTRALFQFDNDSRVVFSDRRRLGRLWLAEDDRAVMDRLGIEPLSAEFTVGELARRLQGRQTPVKAFLLDQAVIAGIGNMYADEALFAAKVHPLKKAGSLSSDEIKDLHTAIVNVLRSAVDNKGASVDTYKRPGGEPGTAHFDFRVAHRPGVPCPDCGTTVQRIVVRNRGSYFCPNCQRQ